MLLKEAIPYIAGYCVFTIIVLLGCLWYHSCFIKKHPNIFRSVTSNTKSNRKLEQERTEYRNLVANMLILTMLLIFGLAAVCVALCNTWKNFLPYGVYFGLILASSLFIMKKAKK